MKIAQKLVINYFRAKLNLLSVFSKRKAAESAFDLFCTPLRKSRPKFPAIFKSGEPLQFELNAHIIHGYRWNESSPKKALIVHGFESSSKNFDRYIHALVNNDYQVLVFDAPAHGRSTGQRITLPLYLDTIKTINEVYGPMDAYIAHSFGGLVLSHYLETVPHNEHVKVVFIAPATETATSIDTFFSFLHLGNGVRNEFDKLIYNKSGYLPEHF